MKNAPPTGSGTGLGLSLVYDMVTQGHGRRILNERAVEEILTLQNPASGVCMIWQRTIGNWYGHDGGGAGASTRVEFQRDDKVGILIFANKSNAPVLPVGCIFELIRREAYSYR